jgi:hypothetical protein
VTADQRAAGTEVIVARLTWQAPDPDALAADLRHRLDVQVIIRGRAGSAAAYEVPLEVAVLELVPWRHEAPVDEPVEAGRLVLEPILEPELEARGSHPGSRSPRSPIGSPPDAGLSLAAIGWGTVELERAARELAPWLGDAPRATRRSAGVAEIADPHLGARAAIRTTAGLPGEVLVLVEPVTEGRLAASLARHGEGPVALYLRPREGLDAWIARTRTRRVTVSARRDGPLGPQVLVLPVTDPSRSARAMGGSAMAGPHLIVVGAVGSMAPPGGDRSTSSRPAPGGNIGA